MNYDEQTIVGLFVIDNIKELRTIETSHGDDDFREANRRGSAHLPVCQTAVVLPCGRLKERRNR